MGAIFRACPQHDATNCYGARQRLTGVTLSEVSPEQWGFTLFANGNSLAQWAEVAASGPKFLSSPARNAPHRG